MSGAANSNKQYKQMTLKPIENPIQDATKTNESREEGNRPKRSRYEQEENDGTPSLLPIPGIEIDDISSGSDSSLFASDSVQTIKGGPHESKDPPPSAKYTQDTHKRDAIRLERLRDKADRYSSHIEFLKECRDTKVIPKGLKIDVEPSIGNYDQEFCAQWFTMLQNFSLTLIDSIIKYSEKVENETHELITTEAEKLKKEMDPEDLAVVTDILDENTNLRKTRLATAKKKKYLHLEYNREERNRPERRDSRRDINRRTNDAPRNAQRDQECPERQEKWDSLRTQRRTPRDQPGPSHREENHRGQDNCPRDDRQGQAHARQQENPNDGEHQHRDYYQDILSRNNSRTTLPRNSNRNLRRDSTHRDRGNDNNREKEISILKERLARYENPSSPSSSSKNGGTPKEGGPRNP